MSYEELDHSRRYGNEWFPTEAELKVMVFQPFSDEHRKDGSITDYCDATRTYRYKNHFWNDNLTPHYYRALDPAAPITEAQHKIAAKKDATAKAHREIEHTIYKLQEAIEDYGDDVDVSQLRCPSYQKIYLAVKDLIL